MMVGNEGKTRIAVYDTMTKAGFDPDKDLFQAPVMPVEGYAHSNFWGAGINAPPNLRAMGGGGFLTDWDLRTNLEGLYVGAGGNLYGGGCHGESHTTGRYAGKHAAEYARNAPEPVADKKPGRERERTGLQRYPSVQRRQRLEGNQRRHRPHHAGLLRPL